ncbi:MAG: Rieske 2Fe-2S domain-containing protein [Granulosicoccus sp.]
MNHGEWCDLVAVDALEENDVTPVSFNNRLLAVYDTQAGVTVSDARCTHAGANLCDGYFDGRHIECPLHQGLFDAVTGEARAAPVTRALKMYPSRVHKGMVQVKAGRPHK